MKLAFGVASAVTVRPQSPVNAPSVSETVPPATDVTVSDSTHWAVKVAPRVNVGDATTSVYGEAVAPSDQRANRNPAAGVACTVTLRPQSPDAPPATIAVVPPVGGVSTSAHCCANRGVSVSDCCVTANEYGVTVEPSLHPVNR